jgi:hypothetical protein
MNIFKACSPKKMMENRLGSHFIAITHILQVAEVFNALNIII